MPKFRRKPHPVREPSDAEIWLSIVGVVLGVIITAGIVCVVAIETFKLAWWLAH